MQTATSRPTPYSNGIPQSFCLGSSDVDLSYGLVSETVGHYETDDRCDPKLITSFGEQVNALAVRKGESAYRSTGNGVVLDDLLGNPSMASSWAT